MKKLIPFLILIAGFAILIDYTTYVHDNRELKESSISLGSQGIRNLEQWSATTSPYTAITPKTSGRGIYAPLSTATTSHIYSDVFCIDNDTPDCITSWPSGGGGGGGSGSGLGTTSPWSPGEVAIVVNDGAVRSLATSSLGLPLFSDIASFITGIAWGEITGTLSDQTDLQSALDAKQDTLTTGNLTENISGLEFNNARQVIGGSAQLSLSSGYNIPLTASTTNWNDFYNTPSGRITAGTGIDWTGNTLDVTVVDTNTTYTAGDALTLTGTEFDFDGGATPAGDLGGTWASPSVDDDSHNHTGSTLSGIDISSDTNLSGDTEIVLTGDVLSIGSTIARDSELHSEVTLSGALDYITLVGQDIVRGAIDLATDVTGVLAETLGGTGQSTYTAGDMLYSDGVNSLAKLGIGTNGYVLQSNGSAPEWVATSSLGITGGGGSTEWNDAGDYVYPKDGDYVSAPYFEATSTTATSTFSGNFSITGFLSLALDYIRGFFGAGLGTDYNGELAVTSRTDKSYIPQAEPSNYYSLDSGTTDWYGTGTTTHDTVDYIEGTGSISIETVGDGATLSGRSLDITDTDLSDDTFRVWIKSDDWADVTLASILISTSGTFDEFYYIHLQDHITTPQDGEWYEVVFTGSDMIATGASTLATANQIIFRVLDDGTGSTKVWFDGLATFEKKGATDGLVSIVWDDSYDEQFTDGAEYLEKYGYKSTFYVIPELIDDAGYMTQDQVESLHKRNHEVAMHAGNSLSTFSEAELIEELNKIKAYQIEYGFGDGFAYPNGYRDDLVQQEVSKRFSYGRNIYNLKQTPNFVSPYNLNAVTIASSTPTSTLIALIDEAIANDEWLTLVFHRLASTATAETEYPTAGYQDVIDYLNTSGVRVLPVEQALRVNLGTSGGGTGDVTGPSSSVDNTIPRFEGTGGKTLATSTASIADSGTLTVQGSIIASKAGTDATLEAYNDDGTEYVSMYQTGTTGAIESTNNFVMTTQTGSVMLSTNNPQLRVQYNGGNYRGGTFYHDDSDFYIGTNEGHIIFQPTENIGIGDTTPASLFTVGSGDLFQVTSAGAISAIQGMSGASGLFDLGGATLEIPNGTGPTADDVGEIAHDTTDDQLILDDYVVGRARTEIFATTISSTSPAFISGGLLAVPLQLDGYTITDIACKVDTGTSKVIAIEDASGNSTEDITCGTTATQDDGSITNATATALEEMYIDFGATTGSVDSVSVTVYGTWTRE